MYSRHLGKVPWITNVKSRAVYVSASRSCISCLLGLVYLLLQLAAAAFALADIRADGLVIGSKSGQCICAPIGGGIICVEEAFSDAGIWSFSGVEGLVTDFVAMHAD